MRIVLSAILATAFLFGVATPAKADPSFFLWRIKNQAEDPQGTPYKTLISGPYYDFQDCGKAEVAAQESDGGHHLFECTA